MKNELYREHILEHFRNPHNFGSLEGKTHFGKGENAFCGDEIEINLIIDQGKIKDVKFISKACALCMASASMLTKKIKEKKVEDVLKMNLKNVLELIKIPVSPARIKCVLLPLETIQMALKKNEK